MCDTAPMAKRPKRPRDPFQLAKLIGDISTGAVEEPKLDEKQRAILEARPRRVVYVSCDPATLARDLQSLLAGGFIIEEIHLFDMFPQTFHIETFVKLVRSA